MINPYGYHATSVVFLHPIVCSLLISVHSDTHKVVCATYCKQSRLQLPMVRIIKKLLVNSIPTKEEESLGLNMAT